MPIKSLAEITLSPPIKCVGNLLRMSNEMKEKIKLEQNQGCKCMNTLVTGFVLLSSTHAFEGPSHQGTQHAVLGGEHLQVI